MTLRGSMANQGVRVAGVDEAGRGALVGNVVAAAVILPSDYEPNYLADSKTLTEKKREEAADYIRCIAVAYAVGRATPEEIDRLNIHHATLLAMRRAVVSLKADFQQVWVDGKFSPDISDLGKIARTFVKGDRQHDCISAASIIAKTSRDAELRALHQAYPHYGFDRHKGYPTKAHKLALKQYGLMDCYRRSYKTVATLIK